MGSGVWGLEFGVWSLGLGAFYDFRGALRFRVWGLDNRPESILGRKMVRLVGL